MADSIQLVTSDGTLASVDVTVPYIDQQDIFFFVDDVVAAPTYTIAFVTATQISISPVIPNLSVLLIKRVTPSTTPLHTFNVGGATFSDVSLDENFKQVLYIAQEAVDGGGATDFYVNLNMHGYTLNNLGPAVNAGDSINYGQFQAESTGAFNQRVLAEAARVGAEAAAVTANAQADIATTQAGIATSQAGIATSQASSASSSAGTATTQATNASNSAIAAAASYDSFDDRYLGAKATPPALDNDGNTLIVGALYWNSVSTSMFAWSGTFWSIAYAPSSGDVAGPASSTDNAVALFDGATGKLLKAGPLTQTTPTDATAGSILLVGASVTTLGADVASTAGLAGKLDVAATAAAATKLATARTINGVSFDGTANITVEDATKLPLAGGALTGGITGPSVSSKQYQELLQVVTTPAATDVLNGGYMTYTAVGANTWGFTAATRVAGHVVSWTLELVNGGLAAQTFTGVQWAGGTAPTLIVAGTDILVFTYDGTTTRGYLAAGDSK